MPMAGCHKSRGKYIVTAEKRGMSICMSRLKKRLLSLICAFAIVCSVLPSTLFVSAVDSGTIELSSDVQEIVLSPEGNANSFNVMSAEQ